MKKKQKKIGFFTVLKLAFILGIAAVLAAFSFIFMIYYGIYKTSKPIPYLSIKPNQFVTTIYAGANVLDTLHGEENREYVPIGEIPDSLINAVISVEDMRFYEHDGVDIYSIFRAIVKNLESGSFAEGASTITQQLVKNNLLKDTSLTLERKIQEQCLAYKLEKDLEAKLGGKLAAKRYVMEQYLNSVNLAHGLNGVKTAAKYYFGKETKDLTLSESTVIAAIIKNPVKFSPVNSIDNNKERATLILNNMFNQQMIDFDEYDAAINDDVYSRLKNPKDYAASKRLSPHSYFVDQLIIDIANDLMYQKGMSENAAYNLIYSGGLSIYSTFDFEVQRIIDETFSNNSLFPPGNTGIEAYVTIETESETIRKNSFCKTDQEAENFFETLKKSTTEKGGVIVTADLQKIRQPQAAFAIIDYRTGNVLGLGGGVGKKEYNLAFNRATQAKRHPGSCFKILAAYAPALDLGVIDINTLLEDEPFTVNGYRPLNYDFKYRGKTSLRNAIKYSINVLAVKTLVSVGYDRAFEYLKKFGFTTLVESEERNGRIYTDKGPALALGGLTDGVTMLELASAYGTIANNGLYNKPVLYTKVISHDGTVLLENKPLQAEVLKPKTAYILTDLMKDVIKSGTGTAAGFTETKMPLAGKTGTSSKDKDLVFAGYTPYYAAAVWMGYDIPMELSYKENYHLLLFRDIMENIHISKGLAYKEFDIPQGVSEKDVKSVNDYVAPKPKPVQTQKTADSATEQAANTNDNPVDEVEPQGPNDVIPENFNEAGNQDSENANLTQPETNNETSLIDSSVTAELHQD